MATGKIIEIGIDDKEQLFIKPDKERFTLIYRTATDVFFIRQNQENGHILIGSDKSQVLQKQNVIAN